MVKIELIGNLGQDATVNTVNSKTVINFSVAHTEKYKNKDGEDVSNTTWVSCAYWTDRINVASYLKKGTQVYVEGKPEAKIYMNASNQAQPQLHLRVTSLQLLSSKNNSSSESEI
jgi:single-strand DNA-binding protein